ncbi:DMT family transporter [Tabrizicola sp.]|jgi:drug/metabolite transporter, DME family|uniref:DMT family transporter n=1 Tax=Tabrizicola sp. TaxID=2005166 RepID=UPI000BDD48E5|nr:DMT family transporter [Tabrizicola sp.]MBY0350967.1 DMT family transporter [Tabrizicola sp.]MDK2774273.1 DMT family transporter [Tabrizicola sp.]OYX18005.1 MAG: EamA family transporter [Rhodobacterales bacterium 32-66-9]
MRYGQGVALVVTAGALWSLMGLFLRQIDSGSTWAILFWRSAGTIPVLLAYIAWNAGGNPLPAIASAGRAGVLGGLALIAAFAGSVYAMQATTVANAVFLFTASPFIAAILGWILLRETVRPATFAAMLVAVGGMYIMVREGLAMGALDGNLAAILSAAGFGTFTVALRWGRKVDSTPIVLLGAIFTMAASTLVLSVQGLPLELSAPDIGWSLLMGSGILATGMILFALGSRVLRAAEATLLSFTEVLLAPIWVFLILGETASPATLIGGSVLLAAVALNAVMGARSSRQEGVAETP